VPKAPKGGELGAARAAEGTGSHVHAGKGGRLVRRPVAVVMMVPAAAGSGSATVQRTQKLKHGAGISLARSRVLERKDHGKDGSTV